MHIIENGNVAAALGVKLCRANVIAAYPITPQTPLTEKLSEYVEGRVHTCRERTFRLSRMYCRIIGRRQIFYGNQRQRASLYA